MRIGFALPTASSLQVGTCLSSIAQHVTPFPSPTWAAPLAKESGSRAFAVFLDWKYLLFHVFKVLIGDPEVSR